MKSKMEKNWSVWADACALIQTIIPEYSYETWIKPISPMAREGNTLYIQTTSGFVSQFLTVRYRDLVADALKEVTGEDWTPVFVYETAPDDDSPPVAAASENLEAAPSSESAVDDDILQLWRSACRILQADMPVHSFATWIKPLELIARQNNNLLLRASSGFVHTYLQHPYEDRMNEALSQPAGHAMKVVILLPQ